MFSGQGSQYYHMGKELYECHSRFRLWMDHCDEIVESLIDVSLVDILYDRNISKSDPFDRVLYTNPALLCIEYSLSRVLMEMDIQPDYLLGYSLGEFTAAVVSGAMSLEQGLELLVDYAKLLEAQTPASGMLAIIDSSDIINQYPTLFADVWLTGNNFGKNFVVSGLVKAIDVLQASLKDKNIICQRLAVDYGFHTELVDPIESQFKQLVAKIDIAPMEIPIISALKSREIETIDEHHFWQVTREPVDFAQTIYSMINQRNYTFIDVGPSGTLATFVKYLLPADSNSLPLEVINQFGHNLQSLDTLLGRVNKLPTL